MSTSDLTPRRIDPGWLRRWTKQSLDLWTRAPAILAATLSLLLVTDLLLPESAIFSLPVLILATAFLFTLLRALDQGGGRDAFACAWRMFRGCLHDLWWFTVSICLWIMGFAVFLAVLSLAAHTGSPARHTANVTDVFQHAFANTPLFLRNGFTKGFGWFALLSMPFSSPVLYLTLLSGNHLAMHLPRAERGLWLNWKPALLGMGAAFFLRYPPILFLAWLAHKSSAMIAISVGDALALGGILVTASFGYLFSREMFEGMRENAPRKAAMEKEKAWKTQAGTA